MKGLTLFAVALTTTYLNHDGCHDLGDPVEGDDASFDQSEPLDHLYDALEGPAPEVDHFVANDEYRFVRAPDPSAFLRDRFLAHQALPALGNALELRVLTYNLGLLDRDYLIFENVAVPEKDQRLPAQARVLFTDGWDVMFLQEVWDLPDRAVLSEAARSHGYTVYEGPEEGREHHGLFLAVRSELVGGSQVFGHEDFEAQRFGEHFPGPNVLRGWLEWSFDLAGTDKRVHLFDTHATSFADLWEQREEQARQLGGRIATFPHTDVMILGGDLNSGPYYARDVWTNADGDGIEEWWRNAAAYPLWLHYGQMYDAFAAAHLAEDVTVGDTLPSNWQDFDDVPFGDASWCAAHGAQVFTGSDCNSLYMQQYAGEEPPARLDHLMIRDPNQHVRVTTSWVDYVQPHPDSGYERELSDHYAIGTVLEVAVD